MFTVYAIQFQNRRIYVGMTNNLTRRLAEHKHGKTKSTKNRGHFKIIFTENCLDRMLARQREKYWKSGCGKEQLKSGTIGSVG